MQRLIEFIKTRGHFILFLLLEAVAILLLYKGSNYHNSIILSSANSIVGNITRIAHTTDSYIGLKDANIELMQRNANLEREVLLLKNKIERLTVDSLASSTLMRDTTLKAFPYEYITAKVIGNIIYSKSNYLTIDKGYTDGVQPDMGVVSTTGVVGIVQSAGAHFSKVIPLINSQFAVSCKVNGTNYFGSLKWDGVDIYHSLLTNLPKHVHFNTGDSIYTNGYSAIFPDNIYVGNIVDEAQSKNDNFYALKIKLSTDFSHLKYVYVISNYTREERIEVEQSTTNGVITPPTRSNQREQENQP